jgi:hypothetical protein
MGWVSAHPIPDPRTRSPARGPRRAPPTHLPGPPNSNDPISPLDSTSTAPGSRASSGSIAGGFGGSSQRTRIITLPAAASRKVERRFPDRFSASIDRPVLPSGLSHRI